ncbi:MULTISPECIES: hypothetical protein [unclassified Nostoc]|uniref:hypothetical protein n=1 Tax=unclassified Nostoc TaxID=2593658 RepID=UPI0026186C23|nr:hypothetical protein [Nostoc sp. S13]MDF5738554.1 hypothetical protein [Nostoc sp. S13]
MNSPFPLELPQSALEPLLALRDYYAPQVEQYEKLYTQAKANLTHVEALLSNWSFALEVAEQEFTPEKEENSLLFLTDNSDLKLEEPSPLELLQLDDSESGGFDAATDNLELAEPPILPLVETSTQQRSLYGVEIPMLPEYQSLSRTEAIERLLAEEIGIIVHIDVIVRSLYGELEPDIFKLVKGRVQSSLTQGREANKWSFVKGKPGYYTLDSRLLTSNPTKNSLGQNKHKNHKSFSETKPQKIPKLEAFEELILIDAISDFLEQNSAKVFSINEIIEGLYGKLAEDELKQVKGAVQKELSRGYRTGRFSRVPNQIGFYTWDYELIRKSNE